MARHGAVAVIAAAAGLVLAAVVASSGGGPKGRPGAGTRAARVASDASPRPAAERRAERGRAPADAGAVPRAEAEPARVPRYGRDPDPFIRQRHDYPPDTPEKLGPKIGRYLFDLERVKELVRLGDRPDSELARARGGEPLAEEEREAARRELQAFFAEMTPVVDQVLAGELPRARALPRIRERRRELDRALGEAVGVDLAEVLPHIGKRRD